MLGVKYIKEKKVEKPWCKVKVVTFEWALSTTCQHREKQQWIIHYCSQFHEHLTCSFCADILFPKNNKAKLQLEKSCKKTLVQKIWTWNVGEIDTWSKFHQQFTRALFAQNFGAKNYKAKMQ